MRYKDNFDEFGNLREDHIPWALADLCICAALVMTLIDLTFGWF